MGGSFESFEHVIDGHTVHGVMGGSPDKIPVIFIHGAPGDWKAWGEYMGDPQLQARSFMIAVDRPGFAGSDAGTPVLSLEKQASLIMEAALSERQGPFVLVGHSYGGPVQLEIAANYPDHTSSMIILAGAIDPDLQASRWYHHLANTWAGRIVLPDSLNVTTKEMLSLPAELMSQQSKLAHIEMPIVVIQGEKDWLVPPGNADYAEKELSTAKLEIIRLPKQGHFLPWLEYDLVKAQILRQIEALENPR